MGGRGLGTILLVFFLFLKEFIISVSVVRGGVLSSSSLFPVFREDPVPTVALVEPVPVPAYFVGHKLSEPKHEAVDEGQDQVYRTRSGER